MVVTPELRALILRLYLAEHWRVGTIARQLQGCCACCRPTQGEEGMSRRGAGARRPTEIDQGTARFARPTKWTPAQAYAVLEVLDEIRDWIWLVYGSQILQELRRDCAVTKAANLANLSDEDVPF
jgi:hypothetical protein